MMFRNDITLTLYIGALLLLVISAASTPVSARPDPILVQILNPPETANSGEEFQIQVKIIKSPGEAFSGTLKSYITVRMDEAGGFQGSEQYGDYIAVNEKGWGYQGPSNKIHVSMMSGETEKTYTLTNKVMDGCPPVEGNLKARLRSVTWIMMTCTPYILEEPLKFGVLNSH